jgi:putative PIN family toxin of toxin-antitoxin system
MTDHAVLDTNVLYAALRSRRGASRRVVDLVLEEDLTAHVSVPLVLEYEEVLLREAEALGITAREARVVIAALVQRADRHAIHFRWPAYVRDPDDSHVLDTAVAASCPHLLTFNKSDFHRASALNVTLLTPREFLAQVFHDPN